MRSLLLPSTRCHPRATPPPKPRRPRCAARHPLLSDVGRPILSSPSSSTLRYYASLASRLALSGRFRDFLMLAESALAPSPSHFLSVLDTGLVAKGVCEVLRGGGSLCEVLDFLGGAHALGIPASSLLDQSGLQALAAECRTFLHDGTIHDLVDVMETLSGYQINIRNIIDPMDILRIFVEKRDPVMAVRYASLHSHSDQLYCSIFQEFGRKGDLTSALKAFEACKYQSGVSNMFVCRKIIDICGLCGNPLKSRDIFEDLLSQGITPNTFVFNSLMNVNAHDLNYTLYVYKHMQKLGVAVDIISYNVLLKACCLAKRVDLVRDIYRELKHTKSSGTSRLTVFTYSTMIKAYSDAKLLNMALEIKNDMIVAGVKPNVVTWTSLIGACANIGFFDQAMQIFEEMLLAGCEPNTQCCNNLLYACVRSCQYDRAFRLFNAWKISGFQLYGALNDNACRDSQENLATDGLPTSMEHPNKVKNGTTKIVPFEPCVTTYNILMKACGSDYYRAKHLMDEMKLMGLFPNLRSWYTLIGICGKAQNVKGVVQALKTMQVDGITPDVVAYTTAIKACAASKDLKIAFSLYEEMKRDNLQPNLVTYNTLLRARVKYGELLEIGQSLFIYQDMRKAGFDPNDYYLKELLDEWCEGVLTSGYENQDTDGVHSSAQSVINNPQNLLKRMADHFQKDIGQSTAIDVRGLSKVEARIIVLSMLRMIKDNHCSGHAPKDDLVIMMGMGKGSIRSTQDEVGVQQSIRSLLQDNLGFDLLVGNSSTPSEPETVTPTSIPVSSNKASLSKPLLLKMPLVRKPEDLAIYRVPRTSLLKWLEKTCNDQCL